MIPKDLTKDLKSVSGQIEGVAFVQVFVFFPKHKQQLVLLIFLMQFFQQLNDPSNGMGYLHLFNLDNLLMVTTDLLMLTTF